MFNRQNTRPAVKDVSELINAKSHVQKKYFSLMLVPSFSSGKTRSIRIPYGLLHIIIISVFLISAIVFGFYMRSLYFEKAALQAGASLDEAYEAYSELQANLEYEHGLLLDEQSRLLDGQKLLKEQLNEAEINRQTEINNKSRDYQENLIDLQGQIEELERQLQELDLYRQEAVDKLEARAYIPPVKELLDEITGTVSLSYVQAAAISSDERSGSPYATENDLEDYFTVFSIKKDALEQSYVQLDAVIEEAVPYIKNYPTMRPVSGKISSSFGYRTDPMGGRNRDYHDAIDISCPRGTDVIATGGGTVKTSNWSGSYGYVVVIDHGFGIQTLYAHNSKLLVDEGDAVKRGDVIAESGSTGNSTGPHVHYEVRVNGVTDNPAKFFLE